MIKNLNKKEVFKMWTWLRGIIDLSDAIAIGVWASGGIV